MFCVILNQHIYFSKTKSVVLQRVRATADVNTSFYRIPIFSIIVPSDNVTHVKVREKKGGEALSLELLVWPKNLDVILLHINKSRQNLLTRKYLIFNIYNMKHLWGYQTSVESLESDNILC